jgi:signal transduction histidine kinase
LGVAIAPADVGKTCDEVRDELAVEAAASNATLRVEKAAGPLWVHCPDVLLSNVLRNLMKNALRYLGDSPHREIVVRAVPAGPDVRIEVEDGGPGVPEGLERRIFEPYVRGPNASAAGLGLGLATVKRIVEAHHGEVGVRRGGERGSVFWFTLAREGASSPWLLPH